MNIDNNIIDMSKLPPPEVVGPVDYEQTLAHLQSRFLQKSPESAGALAVESSVLTKFLEFLAYLQTLNTQASNEDAHAVMLPYAVGSDLDQLGALFQVERLVMTPEDNTTTPPTPAVMETDEALRRRIQLAPKGFTSAGPIDAYVFHALSADARVIDVHVNSPAPGHVLVTLLSNEEQGNGTASKELLEIVQAALNHEDVRPLTDFVQVQSATLLPYTIKAKIHTLSGPDTALVMDEVQKSINAYVQAARRIGGLVPLSGIYAALHLPSVQRVELLSPTSDIRVGQYEAAYCHEIMLEQVEVFDAT